MPPINKHLCVCFWIFFSVYMFVCVSMYMLACVHVCVFVSFPCEGLYYLLLLLPVKVRCLTIFYWRYCDDTSNLPIYVLIDFKYTIPKVIFLSTKEPVKNDALLHDANNLGKGRQVYISSIYKADDNEGKKNR